MAGPKKVLGADYVQRQLGFRCGKATPKGCDSVGTRAGLRVSKYPSQETPAFCLSVRSIVPQNVLECLVHSGTALNPLSAKSREAPTFESPTRQSQCGFENPPAERDNVILPEARVRETCAIQKCFSLRSLQYQIWMI